MGFECVSFRQHTNYKMAHYAFYCWDVKCVGSAPLLILIDIWTQLKFIWWLRSAFLNVRYLSVNIIIVKGWDIPQGSSIGLRYGLLMKLLFLTESMSILIPWKNHIQWLWEKGIQWSKLDQDLCVAGNGSCQYAFLESTVQPWHKYSYRLSQNGNAMMHQETEASYWLSKNYLHGSFDLRSLVQTIPTTVSMKFSLGNQEVESNSLT